MDSTTTDPTPESDMNRDLANKRNSTWLRDTIDNLSIAGAVGIICTFVTTISFVLYNSFDRDIESVGRIVSSNAQQISNLISKTTSVDDRVIALQNNVNDRVVDSAEKVAEIKANYHTQSNELSRLMEDVKQSTDNANQQINQISERATGQITKVQNETMTIESSVASISKTIADTKAETTKISQNKLEIESLNKEVINTDKKINKIEIILKYGITNSDVGEAISRLIDQNPTLFEDLSFFEKLWESKQELTAQEMESHLTNTYSINPKDTLLIAYDELTAPRSLTFFIDKKEIRTVDSREPDLGAAFPNEQTPNTEVDENSELNVIEAYQAVENLDLEKEFMAITDVCHVLPNTPHTECYRMFLKNLGRQKNEQLDKTKIVNNAVIKALIKKYEVVQ